MQWRTQLRRCAFITASLAALASTGCTKVRNADDDGGPGLRMGCSVSPDSVDIGESYEVLGVGLGKERHVRVTVHEGEHIEERELDTDVDGAITVTLTSTTAGKGQVSIVWMMDETLIPLATCAFNVGAPVRDGSVDGGDASLDGGPRDGFVEDSRTMNDGATWSCAPACKENELCCPEGLTGRCISTPTSGECPMPDLTVSEEQLEKSAYFEWHDFEESDCAIFEGCVDAPGMRRLLRFDTFTPNVGTGDMHLGRPSLDNPNFVYSECHAHFHFEGYAFYELLDSKGERVATGRKQAFCLLDSQRYLTDDETVSDSPRYDCGDQGIQRGWGDVYSAGLDCQWIDVTDVPPGDYVLQVRINSGQLLPELSYENNTARMNVTVTDEAEGDPTTACEGAQLGLERDCGWAEDVASRTCEPGTTVTVGCGAMCGLGTCRGDPMVRVCEGSEPCTFGVAIGYDDDTCGSACPKAEFICPESGAYNVMTAPYSSNQSARCVVTVD